MRLVGSERGSSLIELLVGGLIALIALGAIVSLQISAYRNQKADEDRFLAQAEAMQAMDLMARDIRASMGAAALAAGEITLQMSETSQITYTYRSATREVVRVEGGMARIIGTQVEQLAFYPEQNGTLRVEWLSRLPDGTTHLLISKATPRLQAPGSS